VFVTAINAQLLLDSEGIEASGQSDQYKAQLFSMCTLFSSMFVFNHRGVLNLRAFHELSLAATILEDIMQGALLPPLVPTCSYLEALEVIT
jgi:hypothetical protein